MYYLIEEPIDQAHVVAISGELDAGAAPAFRDQLFAVVDRDEPVLLDLSDLTYMDSTCVSVLFAARKDVPLTRENFAIICRGEIRRMFEFTGLDVAFNVVESQAKALSQLVAVG